jgi:hypothetical protein
MGMDSSFDRLRMRIIFIAESPPHAELLIPSLSRDEA